MNPAEGWFRYIELIFAIMQFPEISYNRTNFVPNICTKLTKEEDLVYYEISGHQKTI